MGRLISIRKNLNVTVENERRIQGLRSATLALDPPADLDYTTATNMLIQLGFLFLEEIGHQGSAGSPLVPINRASEVLIENLAEGAVKGAETLEDTKILAAQFTPEGLFKVLAGLSIFQPRKVVSKKTEEVPASS